MGTISTATILAPCALLPCPAASSALLRRLADNVKRATSSMLPINASSASTASLAVFPASTPPNAYNAMEDTISAQLHSNVWDAMW